MPETLDTLAEKITALTTSMEGRFTGVDNRLTAIDQWFEAIDQRFEAIDKRFDAVDNRFDAVDDRFGAVDRRFDELKAELRTEIEAVDAKVGLVLEKVDHLIERDVRHSVVHARFEQRLDNHELRLTALESGNADEGQ